ncbi:EamA family transporter RarD [Spirulina sp. CCNP1310]|uniref:EamA family transporter RarD n=1 Tax=Spirulina sp. CCNP1310 TaxID=3110249 RepID=UPI002B20837A|nr:EamA family transporter RarD [Spirulina sp. CCNP1310]MEA5421510.1 EamA family transporter RarD [Spirulina sp. CCNP1310]
MTASSPAKPGILYAILAYASWGLLPVYWKLFLGVPALEVLSHRIIWSMVFLLSILAWQHRLPELQPVGRSPQLLKALLLTSALLAVNWGIYIYGVNSDRIVETSLGYYINPLVTVLLGMIVFKERLNGQQWLAVALAFGGVALLVLNLGQVPWIALGLAFSFAFYGLVRKLVAIGPLVGLAVETIVLAPISLLLVGYWQVSGVGHWGESPLLIAAMIGAGVITSMPLLWFNTATKQLPLSTMGFLQYIAPSLQLLVGVFLYGEPFTLTHALTFGCIWAGLALYSASLRSGIAVSSEE